MSTAKNWIRAGAEVAVKTGRDDEHIVFDRIERLTSTQIVLAGGKRFRLDTLHKVGDRYGDELLDPASDQVVNAVARTRLRQLAREADQLVHGYSAIVGTLDAAGVLAELEKLTASVQAARDEIAGRMNGSW
jgi:hypothetical protein